MLGACELVAENIHDRCGLSTDTGSSEVFKQLRVYNPSELDELNECESNPDPNLDPDPNLNPNPDPNPKP